MSVEPACGVPETVGGEVLAGGSTAVAVSTTSCGAYFAPVSRLIIVTDPVLATSAKLKVPLPATAGVTSSAVHDPELTVPDHARSVADI